MEQTGLVEGCLWRKTEQTHDRPGGEKERRLEHRDLLQVLLKREALKTPCRYRKLPGRINCFSKGCQTMPSLGTMLALRKGRKMIPVLHPPTHSVKHECTVAIGAKKSPPSATILELKNARSSFWSWKAGRGRSQASVLEAMGTVLYVRLRHTIQYMRPAGFKEYYQNETRSGEAATFLSFSSQAGKKSRGGISVAAKLTPSF